MLLAVAKRNVSQDTALTFYFSFIIHLLEDVGVASLQLM